VSDYLFEHSWEQERRRLDLLEQVFDPGTEQHLGRVPLPGAEAEIAGLRMRAEGGKDSRGRVRITSVVVRGGELRRLAHTENAERERSVERG